MIKSIVFDLGGILVPEAKGEIRSGVANFLGVKTHDLDSRTKDLSMRVNTGELSLRDFYEMTLGRFKLQGITPEQAVEKHLEIYRKHCSSMDSQVLELFEKLKSNDYQVACATNTEREIFQLSSRKGFFELFDRSFISIGMKMAKPQYQFFGRMLDELGSTPRETVFIDDNKYCIERACHIGINGLLYGNFTKLGIDLKALSVNTD